MFVRHHSVIEIPLEDARRGFNQLVVEYGTDSQTREEPISRLDSIGFELAPIEVRKRVDLTFDQPNELSPHVLTARVGWRASGPEALFPVWEGKVELAGHGAGRTRLSVTGYYAPPLGSPGKAMDRVLMNRVAQASIADFVDRLARA